MATQESLDRVQQLYVAYYGRPADQEGQEYWADRLDAEGEGAIINAFGNSEEYAAKAEGQGNATLINAIYEQAFGRGADPEGLAYYAGVLESGEKSLAEIATTIINAAGGQDRLVLNARVEAAAAYTAEFGAADAYDLDAAKAAVEAAKAGVDAPVLTEALTTLATAQTAESDFLKGLVENEQFIEILEKLDTADSYDLDKDSTLDEIRDAVSDALDGTTDQSGAYELAAAALANTDLNENIAARSNAIQDQIIAEAIEDSEKVVATAEKAAEAGVLNAVATVEQRVTSLENALESEFAAERAFKGEAAKFAAVNTNADVGILVEAGGASVDLTTDVDLAAGNVLTIGGTEVATLGANGSWTLVSGANLSGFTGTDALLSAGNTWGAADAAVATGVSSLVNAVNSADNLQVAGSAAAVVVDPATIADNNQIATATVDAEGASVTVDFANVALDTILTERGDLAALEQAAADFEFIRDIRDQAEALAEDVTDASDAITDAKDDGGLGLALVDAGASFTGGNEVQLFDAEADYTANVTGFGGVGEDNIFFGDEYSLVQLDGAWDAEDNTGDASALEIFWEQSGANLNLYVETKAFAGNGSSEGDLVQITLAGVNADDINFANGYLTAGEVA